MSTIDWIVLTVYFCVVAAVIVATRSAKTMSDFAVGSRKIPGGIVFATLTATFIGPGYTMGVANRAADAGFIWFIIFAAFSLQTFLVGAFVAPRLRRYENAFTLGNVMGARYGKAVQLVSGILSVVLCAGLVGAITKASGDIISAFTGLPFIWAALVSAAVVLIYSTVGGIKSVIMTDVLQFVVLSICVPLILFFMLSGEGVADAVETIGESADGLFGHFEPLALLGLLLAFFLGETLIPPYANRALMARDSANARKGFLLSSGFSLSWFFLCACIGTLAIVVLPQGTENFYLGAMQEFLPIGILGLAVAAMISIIMSSQDSCLNAAAVSFSSDILSLFSEKHRSDGKALQTSRILNVVIGIFAVLFATQVPTVVDALLYCYTLWAPTVVIPLVLAVVLRNVHPYAGFGSILLGGLATAIWEWGVGSPYGIPSLVVGIVVNQLVFWIIQAAGGRVPDSGWFAPTGS